MPAPKSNVPAVRPRDTRRNGPQFAGAAPMKPPQKWTPEEDELLRKAVAEIGATQWKLVAERVPGRNHVQCMQRYWRVLKPGLKKGHWTPEEDEKLRSLAEQGFTTWIEAAKQIPGRSAKQCRDRWRNHLESSIKHGPWEPEEDALLLELHAKHGNRWAAIARCIPGRTENAVKIHCKTLLSKMKGQSISEDIFKHSSALVTRLMDAEPIISGDSKRLFTVPSEDTEDQLGEDDEQEEEDEEDQAVTTADDLSSLSPLPSPMVQSSQQWIPRWPSTGTASQHSQFLSTHQHPGYPQGNAPATIQNVSMSHFLPPSIVLRRNSIQSNAGPSGAVTNAPIYSDGLSLTETAAMLEVPTPSHPNAAAPYTPKTFHGAIPLAFRTDVPPLSRGSSENSLHVERYNLLADNH